MKKVYKLKDEKRNPERIVEAIKHEIRKYIKRERRKKLPKGAVYWEFDCRFGESAEDAKTMHSPELFSSLERAREAEWDSCYAELIRRPVYKKNVDEDLPSKEPIL